MFISIFVNISHFCIAIITFIFLTSTAAIVFLFYYQQSYENGHEAERGHIGDWVAYIFSHYGGYWAEGASDEVHDTVSLTAHEDGEEELVDVVAEALDGEHLESKGHKQNWQDVQDLVLCAPVVNGYGD